MNEAFSNLSNRATNWPFLSPTKSR